MCIEDVRLGRQSGGSETNPLVATTPTLLVGSDPKRTVLIIYPPLTGTATVSTLEGVAGGVGIPLSFSDHPINLGIQRDGLLVTKAWYAVHSVGGVRICCQEARLDVE